MSIWGRENNQCEAAEVRVCPACLRNCRGQCDWERVGKVQRDGKRDQRGKRGKSLGEGS